MSGLEIERKFLVHKSKDWKKAAFSSSRIQQGYFSAKHTVRVRVRDEKAYLTIKGASLDGGLSRYEFEKEISLEEARRLLEFCEPGKIDKRRYLVNYEGHLFEIDEFYGDNEGLVMAEAELKDANETLNLPEFIGMEVTGDSRFYNSHLRVHPFKLWRDALPKEYR